MEIEPLVSEMALNQGSVLEVFVELMVRRQFQAACGLFGRDIGRLALTLGLDRSELPIETRQVEERMDESTRADFAAMWRFAVSDANEAAEGDDRELTLMVDMLSGFLTNHAKRSEKHLFFLGEIVVGPAKLVQLPSLDDLGPAIEWFTCRDLTGFQPL